MKLERKMVGAVVAAMAGAAWGAGPDVTLLDIQSTSNHGVVGLVRAYSLGSHTCNIGNANLIWANNGTPGLAQNMFRLYDGRLMHIGVGNAKTACCAAAGSGPCGTCNGAGGSVLGAGCLDVYGSGFNSGQTRLAPRSAINAWSGAFSGFSAVSGDAVFRRLQVPTADLNQIEYAGALYFIEGVYVGSDDAASGNRNNNATYRRVTVDNATGNLTLQGSPVTQVPAIRAWRDHGLGVNVVDPSVTVATIDVPSEGRFWYACHVRDNGNGTWRYDYGVYNLSSDRSGGSFSVPIPAGVVVTNTGFNAPAYHSGEIYSNTPWVVASTCGTVTWTSPQTFAQNANTNALRWGTMYSFWFTANTPPAAGTVDATLGLFKPHTPSQVALAVQGPAAVPCYANCDQSTGSPTLSIEDFACFMNQFAAGNCGANCDGSTIAPVLTVGDFGCFLNSYAAAAGCQ